MTYFSLNYETKMPQRAAFQPKLSLFVGAAGHCNALEKYQAEIVNKRLKRFEIVKQG